MHATDTEEDREGGGRVSAERGGGTDSTCSGCASSSLIGEGVRSPEDEPLRRTGTSNAASRGIDAVGLHEKTRRRGRGMVFYAYITIYPLKEDNKGMLRNQTAINDSQPFQKYNIPKYHILTKR